MLKNVHIYNGIIDQMFGINLPELLSKRVFLYRTFHRSLGTVSVIL